MDGIPTRDLRLGDPGVLVAGGLGMAHCTTPTCIDQCKDMQQSSLIPQGTITVSSGAAITII